MVKNCPAIRETWVQSLGWEDPLEEGMATHFSILTWRISMNRGRLQSLGLQIVGHKWATKHSTAQGTSSVDIKRGKEEWDELGDWEWHISIYLYLCIKQITNETLLYSTGNSILNALQ